jgi:hypothetical protein
MDASKQGRSYVGLVQQFPVLSTESYFKPSSTDMIQTLKVDYRAQLTRGASSSQQSTSAVTCVCNTMIFCQTAACALNDLQIETGGAESSFMSLTTSSTNTVEARVCACLVLVAKLRMNSCPV